MLPDFIIIGAQRAGTTSLYAYLTAHPHIAPAVTKEVHFFDLNYNLGLGWYQAQFPSTAPATSFPRAVITGEASPYYLFHPHAARRLHATLPEVKLIVILRNPIDRAYSHYQHQVRMGPEQLSFEQALAAEEERLAAEVDKMLADETYYSFNHQKFSYTARGRYIDQLELWWRFFPREQMLFVLSERFYANPRGELARVAQFLDVGLEWQNQQFEQMNEGHYQPMCSATRSLLSAQFAPYNERLSRALDWKLDWD